MVGSDTLTVYEVGPRDGLQNERAAVSTEQKVELIETLSAAGVSRMEVTSFVSPKAVPAMADAAEVYPRARAMRSLQSTALIINEKGYLRAREAGCDAVAVVVVVSDTLCRKNNRMTVDESISTAARIAERARGDQVFVRIYLAPAWVCPYDGPVAPERVITAAERLYDLADELAVADTIGHAHPLQVGALFEELGQRFGIEKLAAHLHDTQAMGLANAAAAISAGVRTIDSAIGGLGGCPFAPGAAGNLATEDLVLMAHNMGFLTGLELEALWGVVERFEEVVGRRLGGRTRSWWKSRQERGERA